MRLVRIGVSAVSVKVGDFAENRRRLASVIEAARADGVHLTARGYRVVGERVAEEIIGAYEEYREGNPLAGTD